jgi:hypothetical protein
MATTSQGTPEAGAGSMTEESRRIDVGDFHLISSKTQTPDFSGARSHTARGVRPTVVPANL